MDQLKIRNINNITLIGEYKNMSTKILVRCNECGNEYEAYPQKILSGHICRTCSIKHREQKFKGCNTKKTHDEFISDLNQITDKILVKERYQTAKTPILCECKDCGHEWRVRPTNLLTNKTGCPKCSFVTGGLLQRITYDDFVNKLKDINPYIIIQSKYDGNHNNVKCKCRLCNNVWYALPSNLLRGTGCPRHNGSHGEKFISDWLDANQIKYISQKKFEDLCGVKGRLLSYDFYAYQYNMLIEFQGNFHDHTDRLQSDEDYLIRLEHDNKKRQYAKDHEINLVEIWYYENTEEKLKEVFNIIEPVTTTVL